MNAQHAQVGKAASPDSPPSALRGRWLLAARVSWVSVAVVGAALFVASIPLYYERLMSLSGFGMYATAPPGVVRAALNELGLSVGFYAAYESVLMIAFALCFWAIGVVIFWRRPDDGWALFLSLVLVALGSTVSMTYYALAQIHPALVLLGDVIGNFAFVSFFLLLYLFPDGRFVPRWTRWVAAFYVAYFLVDWFFPSSPYNLDNRGLLGAPVMLVVVGSMVYVQVYRYRRVSGPIERQQTKWIAFGFVVAIVSFFGFGFAPYLFLSPDDPGVADVLYELVYRTVVGLVFLLVPLSIGVAILRYRLWDIDLLINRALVYGTLTASVVGLYVLVVGGLGVLLQVQGNLLVSILAAGLVAVLFAPLRNRFQRSINRLMYGERDDPYVVITRLGERLEATLAPDAVLPTAASTVADALKLPYAAIEVQKNGVPESVASFGEPVEKPLRLPLAYGGEEVGWLVLGPRAGEHGFSVSDLRLLKDITRQIGAAVHAARLGEEAVQLSADLQRSRERLVTAREEERRRLRRDLHDGLGPQLASLTMKVEAARDLLTTDARRADALLGGVLDQAQEAVADVRRLVYALRPPALDALGLLGAIRSHASHHDSAALRVGVETADEPPPLSAAVEVAAYRIALEAINNAARHAAARNCTVRLEFQNDALRLEVRDDGRGIGRDRGSGVGLSSMRERAAELGGSFTIGPAPGGGTLVQTSLPAHGAAVEPEA